MIAHIVNYEHDQCRQCRHLLAGAILAEDIPAVPAVVLPVGEAEGLAAAGAGHHLGVVLPLPPGLLHQLHLHNIECGFNLLFSHPAVCSVDRPHLY